MKKRSRGRQEEKPGLLAAVLIITGLCLWAVAAGEAWLSLASDAHRSTLTLMSGSNGLLAGMTMAKGLEMALPGHRRTRREAIRRGPRPRSMLLELCPLGLVATLIAYLAKCLGLAWLALEHREPGYLIIFVGEALIFGLVLWKLSKRLRPKLALVTARTPPSDELGLDGLRELRR